MVALTVPSDFAILQARILEWVAFPFSRGSCQPRDRSQVFCIADGFFTNWAIRKAPPYLRLLIFLPAVLIPVCNSSSPVFPMMYSAYKLNKQSNNIQPWYTPFPTLNQSFVPCPFLTVASWPAYRFLRRQVRWSGVPISKYFPQFVVIHTVKGFSQVNEAEVDVFLEFSCFLHDPTNVEIWCWFLYLFKTQLVHLEVLSSYTAET